MEIQLVLPEESQAEDLALQRNDLEVVRYTGDPKYPYTKEDALADIRSFLEEENKSRVTRTILADGRPIGIVYFYLPWRGQKSPLTLRSSFATLPSVPWISTVSAPAPWK